MKSNNKFYHRLLEALSKDYRKGANHEQSHIHISFTDLEQEFGLTKNQIMSRTATLFNGKEIGYYRVGGVEGLHATNIGEEAYNDKKYIKVQRQFVITFIKDMVQISVPVLALVVTIIIAISSNSKTRELEQKIKILESKIDSVRSK